MAPKVLVILTSADTFVAKSSSDPKNGTPTGWYLPELAHPYDVLAPKTELTVVSPKGGVAPVDPYSVETCTDDSSVNFLKNHKDVYEKTGKLSDYVGRVGEFDALFYPGGHGPLFDLVNNSESIDLINKFYAAGKPVAAVCHGPAVFKSAVRPDGKPLVDGVTVTGFTNDEEEQFGLLETVPEKLETELVAKGAKFVKAAPFQEKVVTDGLVITGQNPASAKGIGEAILKALKL